jgi:RimJ/RimL family protein N-acetyltransferase
MVTLRRATSTDAKMVFKWRNDSDTRASSRSTRAVGWDEHSSWFTERLALLHQESLWIIMNDGTPVGNARINQYEDDDRAEISIVLAPDYRNRGLGREAIRQLADTVRTMGRVPVAFVRPENRRSVNTFLAAGFDFVDTLVELHVRDRDDGQ